MSELNLPVDMFEEIFNQMTAFEIAKMALINKNAKRAADRVIQRLLDAVYRNYVSGYNVLLTKRINRNCAVQICRTTSDSQGKMFYKINLVLYMRTQISESRFIDMAYPKQ
jgi:hypothetical protein